MFSNLRAEMARKGIKSTDVSEILGVSEKTARNYIDGKTKIGWVDVVNIQKKLFPECKISYLFNIDAKENKIH